MTRIYEYTNKATPVSTDEIEIQETADGTSKKATLANAILGVLATNHITLDNTQFYRGKQSTGGTIRNLLGFSVDAVLVGALACAMTLQADVLTIKGPDATSSIVFDAGATGYVKFVDTDVTNALTGLTNVWGKISQNNTLIGGMNISGYADASGATSQALILSGYMNAAPTATAPVVSFRASKTNGGSGEVNLAATDTAYQFAGAGGTTVYATITGDGHFGIGDTTPTDALFKVTSSVVANINGIYTEQLADQFSLYATKALVNLSSSVDANQIAYSLTADNAGTYTLSGDALQIGIAATRTSGTIANTARGLYISNSDALATGDLIYTLSQGNQKSLSIESNITTVNTVDINVVAPTSGAGLYIHSNAADTTARAQIQLLQDHASAIGAISILLQNDGAGAAGAGTYFKFANTPAANTTEAISSFTQPGLLAGFYKIDVNGTPQWQAYYAAPTNTGGTISYTYDTTVSMSFIDSAATHGLTAVLPTGTFFRNVQADASNGGLVSTVIINADATAWTIVGVIGNTTPTSTIPAISFQAAKSNGTTGIVDQAATDIAFQFAGAAGATKYFTILGGGRTGVGIVNPAYKLEVYNASAFAACCIGQNTSAQRALFIDQNTNEVALYIDSEATSNPTIHIIGPTVQNYFCVSITAAAGLTSGGFFRGDSASSSATARNLIDVASTHASATAVIGLSITNSGTGAAAAGTILKVNNTPAANTTEAACSHANIGTYAGSYKINVGGTTYWSPYYNAPTA